MTSDTNSLYFNKHIIAALIITPILAIITWLGMDYNLREKPQAAIEGSAYELLALPNCRYQSGRCSMKNGDISVDLEITTTQAGSAVIALNASLPLDGVRIALAMDENPEAMMTPKAMTQTNPDRTRWQLKTPWRNDNSKQLRVALAVNDSFYFAEVPTQFTEYHTPFDRDFRRETLGDDSTATPPKPTP